MTLVLDPIIQVANLTTVMFSAFNKVPQIWAVAAARSPAGVSVSSVMIELTAYCITMSYFIAGGYQLSSYLEYPALVLQDVLLLLLVLWLGAREASGATLAVFGAALTAVCGAMVSGALPPPAMAALAALATPVSAASKLVLLRSIVCAGSAQGLAVSSWLISCYTCLTRILTVYVESGDATLLANFSTSLLLNAAIVGAALWYGTEQGSTKPASSKKDN